MVTNQQHDGLEAALRAAMTADEAMQLGNPTAKLACFFLGEAAVRGGAYRHVYEAGRERYADRDGWPKGRQHAAAKRLAAKAILKDLWIVAGGQDAHRYVADLDADRQEVPE